MADGEREVQNLKDEVKYWKGQVRELDLDWQRVALQNLRLFLEFKRRGIRLEDQTEMRRKYAHVTDKYLRENGVVRKCALCKQKQKRRRK